MLEPPAAVENLNSGRASHPARKTGADELSLKTQPGPVVAGASAAAADVRHEPEDAEASGSEEAEPLESETESAETDVEAAEPAEPAAGGGAGESGEREGSAPGDD